MSTSWLDGGLPQGQDPSNGGGFRGPASPPDIRPPICFNCGNEGHFVIACPEPIKSNLAAFSSARVSGTGSRRSDRPTGTPGFQARSWGHGTTVVTKYQLPKAAPVITRYPVPQAPQFGGGSYGTPAAAYQHYGNIGPNSQNYQVQGPTAPAFHPPYTPSQAYGPHGLTHIQAPQPAIQAYAGSPVNYQYSHPGNQPSPHSHFTQYSPQNSAFQYGSPFPQQQPKQISGPHYAESFLHQPQQPATYQNQGPVDNYRTFSSPELYHGSSNQWSKPNPPTIGQPTPKAWRQRSMSNQHDGNHHRQFSRTVSIPTSAQEYALPHKNYQKPPQTPVSSHSQQQASQAQRHSTAGTYEASHTSSRPSTPSGLCGPNPNGNSTRLEDEPVLPTSIDPEAAIKDGGEELRRDNDSDLFDWDFRTIFAEPEQQETVALAQPLSTNFDMTPVPLLDSKSTNSVSRYARKENLKEFVRSIRSAPQWDYLKEDPAFAELEPEEPLIPIRELRASVAVCDGIEDIPGSHLLAKKRPWSDEQEDVDNQIKLESASTTKREPQFGDSSDVEPHFKRQRNDSPSRLRSNSDSTPVEPGHSIGAPGTPVYIRDSTPSCATEDDVWAPQPGECAESLNADPTEALLASLGVSGSPKPVVPTPAPISVPVTGEDRFRPSAPQRRKSFLQFQQPGNSSLPSHPVAQPSHSSVNPNNISSTTPNFGNVSKHGNGVLPHDLGSTNGHGHHQPYSNGPQTYIFNSPTGGQSQYPPRNPQHSNPQHHPAHCQSLNAQSGNKAQIDHLSWPLVNKAAMSGPPASMSLHQDSTHVGTRDLLGNSNGYDNRKRRNSQLEAREQRPAFRRTSSLIETPTQGMMAINPAESQDADVDSIESPLSPTSAEILGKLLPPADRNGKKESQRQHDHAMRKKRQPVVAEAYSRRW